MTIDPAAVAALIADLNDQHDRLRSWRAVAALYPKVIKGGTLCRIAKGEYLPDDRKILRALGLLQRRKPSEIERRITKMANATRKALKVRG